MKISTEDSVRKRKDVGNKRTFVLMRIGHSSKGAAPGGLLDCFLRLWSSLHPQRNCS